MVGISFKNTVRYLLSGSLMHMYTRYNTRYINSCFKPDFSAGPGSWSQSMRPRVCVIKRGLFHTPPGQPGQGKRLPAKGSGQPPLPAASACATGWLLGFRRRHRLTRCCLSLGGVLFTTCGAGVVLVVIVTIFVAAVAVTAVAVAVTGVGVGTGCVGPSASWRWHCIRQLLDQ